MLTHMSESQFKAYIEAMEYPDLIDFWEKNEMSDQEMIIMDKEIDRRINPGKYVEGVAGSAVTQDNL